MLTVELQRVKIRGDVLMVLKIIFTIRSKSRWIWAKNDFYDDFEGLNISHLLIGLGYFEIVIDTSNQPTRTSEAH